MAKKNHKNIDAERTVEKIAQRLREGDSTPGLADELQRARQHAERMEQLAREADRS